MMTMPDHEYIATIRVPTADPYAYLELHHKGSLKEIHEIYTEATAIVKVGVGLEPKEWNQVVDKYLQEKGMHPEDFEKMNAAQKWWIHELDKGRARLKPKTK